MIRHCRHQHPEGRLLTESLLLDATFFMNAVLLASAISLTHHRPDVRRGRRRRQIAAQREQPQARRRRMPRCAQDEVYRERNIMHLERRVVQAQHKLILEQDERPKIRHWGYQGYTESFSFWQAARRARWNWSLITQPYGLYTHPPALWQTIRPTI